jgi:hypothetical protein
MRTFLQRYLLYVGAVLAFALAFFFAAAAFLPLVPFFLGAVLAAISSNEPPP